MVGDVLGVVGVGCFVLDRRRNERKIATRCPSIQIHYFHFSLLQKTLSSVSALATK